MSRLCPCQQIDLAELFFLLPHYIYLHYIRWETSRSGFYLTLKKCHIYKIELQILLSMNYVVQLQGVLYGYGGFWRAIMSSSLVWDILTHLAQNLKNAQNLFFFIPDIISIKIANEGENVWY